MLPNKRSFLPFLSPDGPAKQFPEVRQAEHPFRRLVTLPHLRGADIPSHLIFVESAFKTAGVSPEGNWLALLKALPVHSRNFGGGR